MRVINVQTISDAAADLCKRANFDLGEDVLFKLRESMQNETDEISRGTLAKLLENAEIAASERIPICQDTGYAVCFVRMGSDVIIEGGSITNALTEGVQRGYSEGYLRASVVSDPFDRHNTGDNTPPIVHIESVEGSELTITVAPKGFGSENMSALKMLKPADGAEGVKKFVLETVRKAGSNPCPPIVVGIGIGGNFETVALNAKKALLRDLRVEHVNPFYARMESELLNEINKLGIGPCGFGGNTTALKVAIIESPTHIAGLPAAVNISCHALRHKTVKL